MSSKSVCACLPFKADVESSGGVGQESEAGQNVCAVLGGEQRVSGT